MDAALTFYRDLLGMDVIFDQTLGGEAFDAALSAPGQQQGRAVGGLIGGLVVVLLSLGGDAQSGASVARGGMIGIKGFALSVTDLDEAYRNVIAGGYRPDQEPFAIEGVRMFFVRDPDGTTVEFIELPAGARSTYELHRGPSTTLDPRG